MAEKQIKCTKIRLEFDDGSVRESASADDASQIMDYWNSGSVMAHIHGARYHGPNLIEITPAKEPHDHR